MLVINPQKRYWVLYKKCKSRVLVEVLLWINILRVPTVHATDGFVTDIFVEFPRYLSRSLSESSVQGTQSENVTLFEKNIKCHAIMMF